MSEARLAVVDQAFRKFDKSGDGVVTVEDLSRVYNVRNHPKYVSKEWTEKDCFSSFINSFECSDDKDGKVSFNISYFNFYSTHSKCQICREEHFTVQQKITSSKP